MKSLSIKQLVLTAVAVIGVTSFAFGFSPLGLGESAPLKTIKMKNVDGEMLSIADVQGEKGTLVIFTCNSCPWARGWEERIVALGNEYSEKGLGVLLINSNDPSVNAADSFEMMQQRVAEKGYKVPYVVDEDSRLARAFGATRTPEAFLFDNNDRLIYSGAIDDNMRHPEAVENHYLKDAVEALLNGTQVSINATKALGCTIKFYNNAD